VEKKIKIRKATAEDIKAITRIYNQAVKNTIATFDIRLKTFKSRETWFKNHSGRYPVMVAERGGGVAGWASLSKWSDRVAYKNTAEISIYVDKDSQGMGIGNRLISEIIRLAKKKKFHVLIAGIAEGNRISIHLHEKNGFIDTGVLKEVGFKFNCYIDVHLMQLILD
jgi:L-amino acid N-acyltransferase YncA